MGVQILADAPALAASIAEQIAARLRNVQSDGRRPSIVLTGGTIAIAVYELLGGDGVDWADVDYYWGDERFVAAGHADRNDQQARDAFLTRLGVPEESIHAIPAGDGPLDAAAAAGVYARMLPESPFDLVLLGVGPDGHVASLFPGFDQLHESARSVVEVHDSPKPPPVRITMTLPRLNHAESVWFLVSGEGKAEAVARAHGDGTVDDTPAVGAHGICETSWLLDTDAASHLQR